MSRVNSPYLFTPDRADSKGKGTNIRPSKLSGRWLPESLIYSISA
jgi:hypothetical protein